MTEISLYNHKYYEFWNRSLSHFRPMRSLCTNSCSVQCNFKVNSYKIYHLLTARYWIRLYLKLSNIFIFMLSTLSGFPNSITIFNLSNKNKEIMIHFKNVWQNFRLFLLSLKKEVNVSLGYLVDHSLTFVFIIFFPEMFEREEFLLHTFRAYHQT